MMGEETYAKELKAAFFLPAGKSCALFLSGISGPYIIARADVTRSAGAVASYAAITINTDWHTAKPDRHGSSDFALRLIKSRLQLRLFLLLFVLLVPGVNDALADGCTGSTVNVVYSPICGCYSICGNLLSDCQSLISIDVNWGDGSSVTDENHCHQYTNPGTYQISTTLNASCHGVLMSCTVTNTVFANNATSTVIVSSQVDPICSLSYNFEASVAAPGVQYQWSTSDGFGPVTGNTFQYQFPECGSYEVFVYTSDLAGCCSLSDPRIIPIDINCPEISVQTVCEGRLLRPDLSPASLLFDSLNWFIDAVYAASGPNPNLQIPSGSHNISVEIVQSPGCMQTLEQAVFITPAPAIEFSYLQDCESNSFAYDVIAGGSDSLQNIWLNFDQSNMLSSTAATVDFLPYGVHAFSITTEGVLGCRDTLYDTLELLPPIDVMLAASPASCLENFDGSIAAVAAGGATPYAFNWSNGSSSLAQQQLQTGWYFLTVTDARGCLRIDSAFVDFMPDMVLGALSIPASCASYNNAAIDLTVIRNGSAPYTYAWSHGAVSQDIFGIYSGRYAVTVTDANGCSVADSFFVDEPPMLTASAELTHPECYSYTSGAIVLQASGGTSPHNFFLTPGGTDSAYYGLSAGVYQALVTDQNGCYTSLSILLTEPDPLSVVYDVSHVDCYGDSTAQITNLQASGGTAPYSLTLNGALPLTGSNGFLNLGAGTVILETQDSNGCTLLDTVELLEQEELHIDFEYDSVACHGESDAVIRAIITGGLNPYTYNWSSAATDDVISGLSAGRYELTASDALGCTVNASLDIGEPSPLTAQIIAGDPSCFNVSDGFVALDYYGGTPPYYGPVWNNQYNGDSLTDLDAGRFFFALTDANGCTSTDTVILLAQTLELMLSGTDAQCADSADGSISFDLLQNGQSVLETALLNGLPIAATGTANGLAAGVYELSLSDAALCSLDTLFAIAEPPPIVIIHDAEVYAIMLGEEVQLGATLNYTDDFQFSWQPADYLSCSDCPDPIASPVISTVYCLEVFTEDMVGTICSAESCVEVRVEGVHDYFIPNSFTPNSDGINDDFLIYGKNILYYELKIFNRWGEKVHDSNFRGARWDGMYEAVLQNPGVFAYMADITFIDGFQIKAKGSVTLIR